MKTKIICVLLSIVVCGFLYSCSNEDDDGGYAKERDHENTIIKKVFSNTPGVPITINGLQGGGDLIIKDSWEGMYITKNYVVQLEADCKDEKVLMTCEIYVNGKLRSRKDGNSSVMLEVVVKK